MQYYMYGRLLICTAFGLFARALPDTHEFAHLRQCTEGIELADSIGSDGHKLLNVVSREAGDEYRV